MRSPAIPLVILGGSDRRAGPLPPSGQDKHPLVGYKGVDLRIGGRSLISVLLERLEQSGAFAPVAIAGPRDVYVREGIGARIIDTDGSFAHNIRMGIEGMRRWRPEGPMAITTCDILPDPGELRTLLDDYHRSAPCDLWYGLIRVPGDQTELGAFGWKPTYRVIPAPGEAPVLVLPGHLVVFDPDALRLDFLYRLLEIGYRTRNRPIAYRRSYMLRQLVWRLLAQDLLYVLKLRVPNVTWSVVGSGISAARKLRNGTITREELERATRRIFVKTKHRLRFPRRRVCLPILEGLSLAEDIDTVEEARQTGAGGQQG
jgi:hypothetical protein